MKVWIFVYHFHRCLSLIHSFLSSFIFMPFCHKYVTYFSSNAWSILNLCCLFLHPCLAPGREEGICPHEVPGASESEGPRLFNPFEGSHCLGGHVGQTFLHRPGLSTPKGHMVRISVFWPSPAYSDSIPGVFYQFLFSGLCRKLPWF